MGFERVPFTYTVRPTTDEEFNANMPYLTSSMVEAVNTCPRWGIIHSVHGKRFVTGYRQMALEAGSLMHDVFGALNMAHLGVFRNLPDHMHHHAIMLFGKDRWDYVWRETTAKEQNPTTESIRAFERMAYAIIGTSDFYDDPDDKNRTLANLEHCALELVQYWLYALARFPIYVTDENNPERPVGVEMSLDTVFEFNGQPFGYDEIIKLRTIGLADAVYQNLTNYVTSLGEYKTSASMNDAWRDAFNTRHQITLYNAQLQAYFPGTLRDHFNTILIGSAIPVRRTSSPVQHFTVNRDQQNVEEMLRAFLYARRVIDGFNNVPLETPMFTHSCNRFFRKCSLMDLCTAAREDQEEMLATMPVEHAPSPSEMKALLRNM